MRIFRSHNNQVCVEPVDLRHRLERRLATALQGSHQGSTTIFTRPPPAKSRSNSRIFDGSIATKLLCHQHEHRHRRQRMDQEKPAASCKRIGRRPGRRRSSQDRRQQNPDRTREIFDRSIATKLLCHQHEHRHRRQRMDQEKPAASCERIGRRPMGVIRRRAKGQ